MLFSILSVELSYIAIYEENRFGDKASEGQAVGVYETDFTAESQARKGTMGGTGKKISSNKELTEVGRMAEGD